jgi:lysozyme
MDARTNMIISLQGRAQIKKWEKFRTKAYKNYPNEPWTVGWGSTRLWAGDKWRHVREDEIISIGTANANFNMEIFEKQEQLNDLLKVEVTQNQFDAMMSLIYNIGYSAFRRSTLLKEVNAGNEIRADYFTRWNRVGKEISLGLINRRHEEWSFFSADKPVNA